MPSQSRSPSPEAISTLPQVKPDLPSFDTLAIHAGSKPDPTTGARATPIYKSTSFVFDSTDHAASLFNLEVPGHIYSRISNPNHFSTGVSETKVLMRSLLMLFKKLEISSASPWALTGAVSFQMPPSFTNRWILNKQVETNDFEQTSCESQSDAQMCGNSDHGGGNFRLRCTVDENHNRPHFTASGTKGFAT